MNHREITVLSVAVVAFDRISPFHLATPCVVFGENHPECPSADFKVCATEPGTFLTSTGFDIAVRHGLSVLDEADTIIVPSWRDPAEKPPAPLLAALNSAHTRGAKIVGLCLGAYVLAEAGLLDGRTATTHWEYVADFSERYPKVKLDPNVLYVEDRGVVTSAGTAAGIDCCLYLLRQRHGSTIASHVARRLVVPSHRQGRQAQLITQPIPENRTNARLSEICDWVRQNLQLPHTLESLAERAAISRRTFTRQFKQMTGASFLGWLLNERLNHAQRLLESTDASIANVAEKAGFGSPEALRLHFRRQFDMSPREWRRRFRL